MAGRRSAISERRRCVSYAGGGRRGGLLTGRVTSSRSKASAGGRVKASAGGRVKASAAGGGVGIGAAEALGIAGRAELTCTAGRAAADGGDPLAAAADGGDARAATDGPACSGAGLPHGRSLGMDTSRRASIEARVTMVRMISGVWTIDSQ